MITSPLWKAIKTLVSLPWKLVKLVLKLILLPFALSKKLLKFSYRTPSTEQTEWLDWFIQGRRRHFWEVWFSLGVYVMVVMQLILFIVLAYFALNPPSMELFTSYIYSFVALGFGYFIGVVLHEFGHAIAARVEDEPVKEVGVMFFLFIIPVGAYVKTDGGSSGAVLSAGVLHNLTLVGVFGLLGVVLGSGFLLTIAFINFLFIMENVMPIFSYDGGSFIIQQASERNQGLAMYGVVGVALLVIGTAFMMQWSILLNLIGGLFVAVGLIWLLLSYNELFGDGLEWGEETEDNEDCRDDGEGAADGTP